MTTSDGHPAEDYLKPKLEALIEGAVSAGFSRDVTVAVLIDLLDDSVALDVETR
ncbi:hypothetical protein [Gluconobacter wancherniae]|uniref:hypothetical protein n=1 Tax=Gluconobacter wancherniae TaxID=1307955 RepID=UPI001B8B1E7B|nr:hypothetical protein [Gluconobacter wancherniae]MBS1064051.1 hypothetical protein [Gluconobacter wancherniae]MBS1095599.1 hypothetical protein [Gluconobacter wancherniae]